MEQLDMSTPEIAVSLIISTLGGLLSSLLLAISGPETGLLTNSGTSPLRFNLIILNKHALAILSIFILYFFATISERDLRRSLEVLIVIVLSATPLAYYFSFSFQGTEMGWGFGELYLIVVGGLLLGAAADVKLNDDDLGIV